MKKILVILISCFCLGTQVLAGPMETGDFTVNGDWVFTGAITVPAFTGTTYSGTSLLGAIQAALTELDNAVEISAGTGITINSGVLSVTDNTYQPYNANLLSWAAIAPSTKQAASANLDGWSAIAPSAKQNSLGSVVTSIVSAADCSTYTAAGVLCLETP